MRCEKASTVCFGLFKIAKSLMMNDSDTLTVLPTEEALFL